MSDLEPQLSDKKPNDVYVHDITDIFTVLMGNIQLLERRIQSGKDVSQEQLLVALVRIRQQAKVAHEMTYAFHRFR